MVIEIDGKVEKPIYRQICDQIVAGIALGELVPGMQLPSVRSLAADLGINLHTVNKAYAVLRDEGYLRMKGRAGAFIAEPDDACRVERTAKAADDLESQLFRAALAFRANGGTRGEFLEAAAAQAARAYGAVGAQDEGASPKRARVSGARGSGRASAAAARFAGANVGA